MRKTIFGRPPITAVAIACGLLITPAFSEVIRFDNPPPGEPGHLEGVYEAGPVHFLDIKNPPTNQLDWDIASAFEFHSIDGAGYHRTTIRKVLSGAVLDSDEHVDINYPGPGQYEVFERRIDVPCSHAVDGSDAVWRNNYVWICDFDPEEDLDITVGIPPGKQGYIGVRFEEGGNTYYGWILMQRMGTTHFNVDVEFIAWAYETEPNTPIIAGAPEGCCPGDLNTTATVDVADLFKLLSAFGTEGAGANLAAPTDVVDVNDLFVLLAAWGDCP